MAAHWVRAASIQAGIEPLPDVAHHEGDLVAGWEEFGNDHLKQMFQQAGLDPDLTVAACGPIAAAGLLKAYGVNVDPAQLAAYAQQHHLWSAEGMAAGDGTSMQALLQSQGIQTERVGLTADVIQMIQNGTPVVANFPSHYMLLQGYDPATGRFFVGATGSNALEGGGAWMTLDEMNAHPGNGGALENVIVPTTTAGLQQRQVAGDPSAAGGQSAGQEPLVANPTTRDRAANVSAVEPLAHYYEQKYGIPAAVLMAINIHEGGDGMTAAPFGIMDEDGTHNGKQQATFEIVNGQRVNTVSPFRQYATMNDAYADFFSFVQGPRYKDVWDAFQAGELDWHGFLDGIVQKGYATDKGWADHIASFAANSIAPLMGNPTYSGQSYTGPSVVPGSGLGGAATTGNAAGSPEHTTTSGEATGNSAAGAAVQPTLPNGQPLLTGNDAQDQAALLAWAKKEREASNAAAAAKSPSLSALGATTDAPLAGATATGGAGVNLGSVSDQLARALNHAGNAITDTVGAGLQASRDAVGAGVLDVLPESLRPTAIAAGNIAGSPGENLAAVGAHFEQRRQEGIALADTLVPLQLPGSGLSKGLITWMSVMGVPAETIQGLLTAGTEYHGSLPDALAANDGYFRRFKQMGATDKVAGLAAFGAMAVLDPLTYIPMGGHAAGEVQETATAASRLLRAAMPRIFGGAVGGTAGYLAAPDNATPEQQAAYIAGGAAAGALGAHALARGAGRDPTAVAARALDDPARLAADAELASASPRTLLPASEPLRTPGTLAETGVPNPSTVPSTTPLDAMGAASGDPAARTLAQNGPAARPAGAPAATTPVPPEPGLAGIPDSSPASVAQAPSRRMYHGTGGAFESPDPGKFDPNGLHGPGYYLTSDARVAGSYATERAPAVPAEHYQGIIDQMQAALDAGGLDQSTTAHFRETIADLQKKIADIPAGPNIRAVDVPENLRLLDMEAAVPAEMRQAAQSLADEALAKGAQRGTPSYRPVITIQRALAEPDLTADRLYDVMHGAAADLTKRASAKDVVNKALQAVGFDGLTHAGGQRVPMLDGAGNAIEHAVTVVFPESLPKIRNAISGRQGGQATVAFGMHLGAAGAGGVAGYEADPNAPEAERQRNALIGAGLGLLGGFVVTRALERGVQSERAVFRNQTLQSVQAMHERTGANPGLLQRVATAWDGLGQRLETALTDDFALGNKTGGRAAKAAGLKNAQAGPLSHDPEAWLTVYRARSAVGAQWAKDGLSPVTEALGSRANVDAFNNMVKLKRDIETAAVRVGRGAQATQVQFSGGVQSVAHAKQALVDLEQEIRTRAIQAATAQGPLGAALQRGIGDAAWGKLQQAETLYRAHLDDILQTKVAAGLIDPTAAQALRAQHPNYSPAMLADLEDKIGTLFGKSLRVNVSGIKKLSRLGHTGDDLPPLQAAMMLTLRENNRIMRNVTVASYLNALRNDPKYAGQIVRMPNIQLTTGMSTATGALDTVAGHKGPLDIPGAISLFDQGERQLWKVPDDVRNFVLTLENHGEPRVVEKVFSLINSVKRAGITRLNAPFAIVNGLADSVVVGVGRHHIAPWDIAREWVAQMRNDPIVGEFIRAGGAQEGFYTKGAGSARDLEQQILRAGGIPVSSTDELARAAVNLLTLKPIEKFGGVIEQAPRLAVYRKLRGKGVDPTRAAMGARRATLDFQRAGSAIRQANAVVLFLNAGVQGTLWMGREARDSASVRGFFLGLGALGAASYVYNRQFTRPDGKRYYDDIPQYIRDTSMVFLIPGTEFTQDDGTTMLRHLDIPLRQLGIFSSLPILALQHLDGTDQRDVVDSLGHLLLRTTSPVQGESVLQAVGGTIPGLAGTALQLSTNKQFYSGFPVVSQKYASPVPAQEFKPSTSVSARLLAGAAGQSPIRTEFGIGDAVGGLGQQALAVGDVALGVPGAAQRLSDLSIGRVVRNKGGQIEQNASDAFTGQRDQTFQQRLASLQQTPDWQQADKAQRDKMVNALQADVTKDASRQPDAPAWAVPARKTSPSGAEEPYRWEPDRVLRGSSPTMLALRQQYGSDPARLERAILDAMQEQAAWNRARRAGKHPPTLSTETRVLASIGNRKLYRAKAWQAWAKDDAEGRAELSALVAETAP